jgi:hypothetical protein
MHVNWVSSARSLGFLPRFLGTTVSCPYLSTTLTPSALGNTTQNWLGRSQPPGDPYPDGALDDFRIYSRALRDHDVQELFKSGRPFRISQVLGEASGGLQLTWNSSPDVVVYVIWSCTDLTSGDWTAEPTVPSAGASTSWTDPSHGGRQKFYRVEQF